MRCLDWLRKRDPPLPGYTNGTLEPGYTLVLPCDATAPGVVVTYVHSSLPTSVYLTDEVGKQRYQSADPGFLPSATSRDRKDHRVATFPMDARWYLLICNTGEHPVQVRYSIYLLAPPEDK